MSPTTLSSLAGSPYERLSPSSLPVDLSHPHNTSTSFSSSASSTSSSSSSSPSFSTSSLPLSSHQLSHHLSHMAQHPAYPHLPITPPSESEGMYSQLYSDLKQKRKSFPVPSESKDDAYWERRRRNNESAKRSREIRKRKEMQTSGRIQYLEQENVKLQTEVSFLREEIERLRQAERLPYLLHQKVIAPQVK